MSISIKNISVSIDGTPAKRCDITLEGTAYHLDNFTLSQSLLQHSSLSFTMRKKFPEEEMQDTMFAVCGQIIGKEITLALETDNLENVSLGTENDKVADVEFKGLIVSASAGRNESEYVINVDAQSWDVLLDDNPTCKSFEARMLNDIVNDVVDDYADKLETTVDARFYEEIPYCVQYNETNFQFLQRLARRYGEWLYSDGNQLVFGNLVKKDEVQLAYPSKDVPYYGVDLKIQPVAFNHVASSYNSYDANQKDGLSEMQKEYNPLSEQVFQASQERYRKQTLQNLHSGGYADNDGRETILNVSTKTQARGEKASMLTFSGTTYCTKLKLGGVLTIVDNYITDNAVNTKSNVNQHAILITDLVHSFMADEESYSNHFNGISAECDYPPYSNSDVYPMAPSCRAKVIDNKDPKNIGRIRVQFDWQERQDVDMITPWLRIAQPYAGGGKGFSFIPEEGEEVMVDFEGGNAERPYVKGTLYNGIDDTDKNWAAREVAGSSHNQVKAIRTRNGHTIEIHDQDKDGYIRIYDNLKENYILTFSTDEKLIKLESTGNIELYANNDIIMKAGHDMKITVGNDRELEVGRDDTTTVGNDQSVNVGSDQIMKVGANQETTVGSNNVVQIRGNQIIDVNGNKDERVVSDSYFSAKNHREEVDDEIIVIAESQQHKSSSFTKIDGGRLVDIKAATTKVN